MVKIGLQLKADLENLTELSPVGEDFRWYIKAKCNNCGEETHDFVYVCALEKASLKGSRGDANLVMKCRFCARENNMIDLVPGSLQSYTADDSGNFKTVVAFLCRGVEPTAFDARAGWSAKGAETTTRFEDIDLKDLDWSDYDEKAAETVGIYNLESRFVKLK